MSLFVATRLAIPVRMDREVRMWSSTSSNYGVVSNWEDIDNLMGSYPVSSSYNLLFLGMK